MAEPAKLDSGKKPCARASGCDGAEGEGSSAVSALWPPSTRWGPTPFPNPNQPGPAGCSSSSTESSSFPVVPCTLEERSKALFTTRKIYNLIKTIHHYQNVTVRSGNSTVPFVRRMVDNLINKIEPAFPNPEILNKLIGNAESWGHATLSLLQTHYKDEMKKCQTSLSYNLPDDWRGPFEVALKWLQKSLPRLNQETINQAILTIIEIQNQGSKPPEPQDPRKFVSVSCQTTTQTPRNVNVNTVTTQTNTGEMSPILFCSNTEVTVQDSMLTEPQDEMSPSFPLSEIREMEEEATRTYLNPLQTSSDSDDEELSPSLRPMTTRTDWRTKLEEEFKNGNFPRLLPIKRSMISEEKEFRPTLRIVPIRRKDMEKKRHKVIKSGRGTLVFSSSSSSASSSATSSPINLRTTSASHPTPRYKDASTQTLITCFGHQTLDIETEKPPAHQTGRRTREKRRS